MEKGTRDWNKDCKRRVAGTVWLKRMLNGECGVIHTRMPVILDKEAWSAWLDGSTGTELLEPDPAEGPSLSCS